MTPQDNKGGKILKHINLLSQLENVDNQEEERDKGKKFIIFILLRGTDRRRFDGRMTKDDGRS